MIFIKKTSAILICGICIAEGLFAEIKPVNPAVDSAKLLLEMSNNLANAGDYIQSLQATKALHYFRMRNYEAVTLGFCLYANLINAYI
jgi:hypothetical protein